MQSLSFPDVLLLAFMHNANITGILYKLVINKNNVDMNAKNRSSEGFA